MSRSGRIVAWGIAVFLLGMHGAAHAAACVSATRACTEWIAVEGGPARVLAYRTQPLTVADPAIDRVLVVVHGRQRNAGDYFSSALVAAREAGVLERTLVVSLRFASDDGRRCRDSLAADELSWGCSGPESWRNGGAAAGHPDIASYDVLDGLLRMLARRRAFPRLERIVVAGHSAGGQYVARYAMANRIHEGLAVPVRYVVANPSSYTYLDDHRPTGAGATGTSTGGFARPAQAQGCPEFDRWPYGLSKRAGYVAGMPEERLRRQAATRPIVFLLGGRDTEPDAGFDTSCAAMLQGASRLARGTEFARALAERHGARHEVRLVPACGHSAGCMFRAREARDVLFAATP